MYKQGEMADGLYIIREGEFQMVCKIPTKDSVSGKKFLVQREKTKQVDVTLSLLKCIGYYIFISYPS